MGNFKLLYTSADELLSNYLERKILSLHKTNSSNINVYIEDVKELFKSFPFTYIPLIVHFEFNNKFYFEIKMYFALGLFKNKNATLIKNLFKIPFWDLKNI